MYIDQSGTIPVYFIIGAKRARNPANLISADLSLSTNHMRAFSVMRNAETEVQKQQTEA